MLFWIAMAGLTALVLAAVLMPVMRSGRSAAERADYDVQIFRDQLAELERDAAAGLIDQTAADAARNEIARRILAESPELTKVVHLVATIKSMQKWEGRKRLVVGFAAEATQTHIGKKPPMGFQIAPGTVFLGHEAGIGHKVGDEVDILPTQHRAEHRVVELTER